ncbi:hypothetical protein HK101_011634 [Irineochytrium annulatum]|nr:hypothetical protein HK101_011634 [Irineochytrium annulatum]
MVGGRVVVMGKGAVVEALGGRVVDAVEMEGGRETVLVLDKGLDVKMEVMGEADEVVVFDDTADEELLEVDVVDGEVDVVEVLVDAELVVLDETELEETDEVVVLDEAADEELLEVDVVVGEVDVVDVLEDVELVDVELVVLDETELEETDEVLVLDETADEELLEVDVVGGEVDVVEVLVYVEVELEETDGAVVLDVEVDIEVDVDGVVVVVVVVVAVVATPALLKPTQAAMRSHFTIMSAKAVARNLQRGDVILYVQPPGAAVLDVRKYLDVDVGVEESVGVRSEVEVGLAADDVLDVRVDDEVPDAVLDVVITAIVEFDSVGPRDAVVLRGAVDVVLSKGVVLMDVGTNNVVVLAVDVEVSTMAVLVGTPNEVHDVESSDVVADVTAEVEGLEEVAVLEAEVNVGSSVVK